MFEWKRRLIVYLGGAVFFSGIFLVGVFHGTHEQNNIRYAAVQKMVREKPEMQPYVEKLTAENCSETKFSEIKKRYFFLLKGN